MSSSEPTSPRAPLASFPPLPPAEDRSRAPEFYGFVAWTSTSLLFVLFALWAVLPDKYIIWLGIDWYPNREWALLLPAYSVVVVLLTYFIYFALALASTPAFSDWNSVTDTKALFPALTPTNPYFAFADPDATPEPYDIPIGMVNRVLYGLPHPPKEPPNDRIPPGNTASNPPDYLENQTNLQ